MTGNIGGVTKTVIIILQVIITLIGVDIRNKLQDHEKRIDTLESFAQRGDRWTSENQRAFERELASRFDELNNTLTEIKVALAEQNAVTQRLVALEKSAHIHEKP